MNTAPNGVKFYFLIFAWLAAITLLEIASVMVNLPRQALIIFIVGTALAKAFIIAMFFMHLKFENPLIWWVPAVPLALALFFVGMLFPDMVYHLTLELTSRHP